MASDVRASENGWRGTRCMKMSAFEVPVPELERGTGERCAHPSHFTED